MLTLTNMRNHFTKLLLVLALTAVACKKDSNPEAAEKAQEAASQAGAAAAKAQHQASELAETAAVKASEAAAKTDDAVEELKRERDAFMAASAAKLQELDGRILELETRAKENADKVTEESLVRLRAVRAEAHAAYERTKAASSDTWTDIKRAYDEAYAKAAAAYEDADRKVQK